MIPQHTNTAKIEGSIGGTTVAASVDAEDMAHIMQVLTDLYSDNVLACIREYSTNARDMHIKFGVGRPIEVTLPSPLSNTLTIRDFGPGQSAETMVRTYTKYGKSNKRDSAAENGFLGIGSKSALTYTSTFTVVSVHEGIKTQAVVFRDEDDLLHINVVSSVPSDDLSGTTVTIPTKIGDDFKGKAHNFFKVWDQGTVLVNGDTPEHISQDASLTKIGNHYVRPAETDRYYRSGESKMHVVMGNVTYTVPMTTPENFRVGIEAYSFVPNGSVKFVPSREALDLKPWVKDFIDAEWKSLSEAYFNHFTSGLAKATTIKEAVALYLPMQRVIGAQSGLVWNGIALKDTVQYNGRQWSKGWQSNGLGSTAARDRINLSNAYAESAAFLTGRKSQSSLSSGEKARLALYLQSIGSPIDTVYFNGDDLDLLTGANTVDWQAVLTATKTHVVKQAKTAGEWEYFTHNGLRRERHFGAIPAGKHILFGSNSELTENRWNPIDLDFMLNLPTDYIFVTVAVNRAEKFKREQPGATHFRDFLDSHIAKIANSLTADEKLAYKAYERGNTSLYGQLAGKTDDPTIDRIHATLDAAREKAGKADRIMRAASRGSFRVGGRDYIEDTYPLADSNHIEHTILYINYIKNGK